MLKKRIDLSRFLALHNRFGSHNPLGQGPNFGDEMGIPLTAVAYTTDLAGSHSILDLVYHLASASAAAVVEGSILVVPAILYLEACAQGG